MEEVVFTLGGKVMRLRRGEVVAKLKNRDPEQIRSHAVEVDGRLFPMKQAFSVGTGLDIADFTTHQARRQLKKLGFAVSRV